MAAKTTGEKRKVRTYKVKDSVYNVANKIAGQNNTTVANMVEDFLILKSKKQKQ